MFCLCHGISCGKKRQTQRTWDNEQQLFLGIYFIFCFRHLFDFYGPSLWLSFDLFSSNVHILRLLRLLSTPHFPDHYYYFFFRDFSTTLRLSDLPRALSLLTCITLYPPASFPPFSSHRTLFIFSRTSMPNYHDIEFNLLFSITIRASFPCPTNYIWKYERLDWKVLMVARSTVHPCRWHGSSFPSSMISRQTGF